MKKEKERLLLNLYPLDILKIVSTHTQEALRATVSAETKTERVNTLKIDEIDIQK